MTEEEGARREGGGGEEGLTPERMRSLAEDPSVAERVRDNLVSILNQGFEQIESSGFSQDPQMKEDWKNYKKEVEELFRSASPNDPLFRQKLREMTEKFARGTN